MALLLGAAACAARAPDASRSEALLSDRPPPGGRPCRVSAAPEILPAADALVDSAALAADLRALARRYRLQSGYALLSLEYDRNGWNARRQVIEHDLPAEAVDSLQQLVFARRRELPPGDPVGVRLRVDLGDPPALRVGRQEVCPPRLVGGSDLVAEDGTWGIHRAEPGPPRWRGIQVRVLVDERGAVADARVERSPVSIRSESALLNLLRSLTFEPALVDGLPVPRWTRVTVPAGW